MLNLQDFKYFKPQIYLAFVCALLPFCCTAYLFSKGSNMQSHGKARWASAKEIEAYSYSVLNFLKNLFGFSIRLLGLPLIFFIPDKKSFIKNITKNFLETCKLGLTIKHPMTLNFKQGVVVGKYEALGKSKPVYYDSPLSTLIIAPPGSGKTAAVAIPNLLTLKNSVVVLDIKGELCDLTAKYRQKKFKNKIFVFNPLGDDNTLKFNPFDKKIVSQLDFNRKRRLVDEVGNTIFTEENDNKDPHWTQQARNLFIFYALYDLCVYGGSNFFEIASCPIKNYVPLIHPKSRQYAELFEVKRDEQGNAIKDANGAYIQELDNNNEPIQNSEVNAEVLWYRQVAEQVYLDVEDSRNYDGTVHRLERDTEGNIIIKEGMLDPIIRNDANRWANANDREFASIKSVYSRFMQVFTSYQVKEATSSMSFAYEDLRRENISLYIKIAQTDINTLAPLIRILLESMAKNLLLRESQKFEERVYFILDEFVRFGKLPFLLEMPALSRSYGVVILFITQSNALIEKYYGKDDAKIVNGTVAYKIVFKMDDLEYAKQLSEEIGKMTRKTRSHSTEKGQLVFGGTSSIGKEAWDLLSPQDIMNIDSDEVIILVSGHKAKPLKLKANYYFKDSAMMKGLKDCT